MRAAGVSAPGEINGGGVRFSPPGAADAGQNLRAAAVVGQWQAAGMTILFPAAYATGQPETTEQMP